VNCFRPKNPRATINGRKNIAMNKTTGLSENRPRVKKSLTVGVNPSTIKIIPSKYHIGDLFIAVYI
tara:strand:+ start:64 stop:261 length:198 start_codon:yes stop_codon:yes gene_type:complete